MHNDHDLGTVDPAPATAVHLRWLADRRLAAVEALGRAFREGLVQRGRDVFGPAAEGRPGRRATRRATSATVSSATVREPCSRRDDDG